MKIQSDKFLTPDHLVGKFFVFTLALSFVGLGFLGFSYRMLPSEVPLFYSNPWGKEQLAPPYLLFLPYFLSFVFLVVNLFLINRVFRENSFVRNLLVIGIGLIFLLSAITTIKIIFLIS